MKTIAYTLVGACLVVACASKIKGTDTGATKGYVNVQLDQYTRDLDDGGTETEVALSSYVIEAAGARTSYTTIGKAGECTARKRALSYDAGAGTQFSTTYGIGSVTVRGGQLPASGLTAAPGQTFEAPATLVGSPAFAGGETLEFTATGGTLPGFTSKRLVAPSRVTLTSPVRDGDGVVSVSRGSDLTLRWTGGTEGVVGVALSATDPSTDTRTYISCEFARGASTGVIPASILASLPLSNTTAKTRTLLSVSPDSVDETTVDGWDYGIYVTNDGDSPSVNVVP